jgi:ribosomal protein S18 acetylase RimI-like enzyme
MTVLVAMATADDVPRCARLIAEAFLDDPVVHRIVPGAHDRLRRLTELFVAELRSGALPLGVIDVARTEPGGEIVGVAAWEGPHRAGAGWRGYAELPRYARAIGPRHLLAARSVLATLSRHRPADPHWYLGDIAVGGAARGLGVGSALLDYRLRGVDAQALPAYLEATTPSSRRLYERYGFRLLEPVDLGGGATAYPMLRPAGGA